MPGTRQVPVAGLSEVAVLPTFRRRGVLRVLVRRLLDDAAKRGLSMAVLFASEGGIYGRFGFAPACFAARYRVDLARAALRSVPEPPGTVRLLTATEARGALPEVFDLARRARPGEIDRSPTAWQAVLDGPVPPGIPGPGRFICSYVEHGRVDGYAVYDVGPASRSAETHRDLELVELVALHSRAEVALWRYLTSMDLVSRLVTDERPTDEPLRHLLVDPRALETTAVADHLWLRVLDPLAALAARRYSAPGRLVLEVDGDEGPATRVLIEAADDGEAVVTPSVQPAEVRLDLAGLGACYLGATTPALLGRVGRADELVPGALDRASALFAAASAPFCTADI